MNHWVIFVSLLSFSICVPLVQTHPWRERQRDGDMDVLSLLQDTLSQHLCGCFKVLLYSNKTEGQTAPLYVSLAGHLSWVWGTGQVWEIESFLSALPTPYPFTSTHQDTQGKYCIAFVILAHLDEIYSTVLKVQHGGWLVGSIKYLLVYSANTIELSSLENHPIKDKAFNLVLVSPPPKDHTVQYIQTNEGGGKGVFRFIRICPYCENGKAMVEEAGFWTTKDGFINTKMLYPDLFKNFNEHEFKVVTLIYEPFSCYEKTDSGIILHNTNCVDNIMLNNLAQSLNFTYQFMEPRDGQWGHRLQNGSYTGVIGTVERMEADFSLNIAITRDREEVVDCTVGYHVEPITFATSRPTLLNQALALIRPFSSEVWLLFILVLVLSGPIYYYLAYVSIDKDSNVHQVKNHRDKTGTLNPRAPGLIKACLMVFGACFNQEVKWVENFHTRLFGCIYVIGMYTSLSMYVAMLTASLTLPTLSPTLNTLTQLVQSEHEWGIQDLGAADYQLLKTSQVPLYQKVFQGLQPCPSLDECIMEARNTKFAFITWRTYLEDRIAVRFTTAGGERQLHVATGDIFPVELGWAMTPGCPYRNIFNKVIRTLIETGLVAKWLRDLINDPKRREVDLLDSMAESQLEQGQIGSQALGLHHLQGAFFLLLMGACVSGIAFVCEVILKKK